MAAPLGFKTFTTGEVLTAADTNGYLMQGVLVFADAAARSAAITSPQEGQTSYLKDTDEIQVYSGSTWVTKSGSLPSQTGNSGKYLTTDGTDVSWGAVTGWNPNYQLLNAGGTSLTGSSVTISGISGINSLFVYFTGLSTTVNASIGTRLNTDSGSNYLSIYSGSNTGNGFTDPDSSFATVLTQSASYLHTGLIQIDGTNSSGQKIMKSESASKNDSSYFRSNGRYTGTSTISSLTILTSAGNFDAGTIYVYGA
jgi:hypothetical protein